MSFPSILAIVIRGFHSFPLFSSRRMMSSNKDEDPFSSFLEPDHRSNPNQFIKTYFQLAKASASPSYALSRRHKVEVVGINKAKAGSYHESLTIIVFDDDTKKTHVLIIERTASSRSIKPEDNFKFFTQFPDSKAVLDSIQLALQEMSVAVYIRKIQKKLNRLSRLRISLSLLSCSSCLIFA
jgi:hypothetical protein